ncbi:MAG: CDP-glycerol glycerophosphotransferase family protein [Firmicutes bacterium]|nr:CDP-glycerol glycerophosphotransferase family protein [Bacillota bacterium]
MKKILIACFVGLMRFIYFFIKLASVKDQVTIISRQSDEESLDLRMLREELESRGIRVNVLCRKLSRSIGYAFHMLTQMKCIATSKAVIIDSYCIPVSILKHRRTLRIMQIWHALSAIKQFGRQTVDKEEGSSQVIADGMHMHENYDYVAAPSRVTGEHFCRGFGCSRNRIVVLGLPRTDYIAAEDSERTKEIKKHYDLGRDGRKIILYVPTFRRTSMTDYASLARYIDKDRYDLLVRLHPLDETPKEQIKGVTFADEYDSYDLLKACDIVISDYSSFVVEASITGKPLYLYTYDIDQYEAMNGLNVHFSEEAVGKYQFRDAEELAAELENDYDYEALTDFRKKFIEVAPGTCTGKMADFIEERMIRSRSQS